MMLFKRGPLAEASTSYGTRPNDCSTIQAQTPQSFSHCFHINLIASVRALLSFFSILEIQPKVRLDVRIRRAFE